MTSPLRQLRQLAHLYGVQTAYYDVSRRRRPAAPESLLRVLHILDAPVEQLADVPDALRARRRELWQRVCEPVLVTWVGKPTEFVLRLSAGLPESETVVCHLKLESGEEKTWPTALEQLPLLHAAEHDGSRATVRQLILPEPVPPGYHRVWLECRGQAAESLLIAAPLEAYATSQKTWGTFLPLYALHSRRSWGGGDFSDLEMLTDWVTRFGGSVVATLPLLTAFLDEPYDPSPYAPASRLFWNELYLDVPRVPELQKCPAARELLESSAVQAEIAALRSAPLVDYRRQMALKRKVLEELARSFFTETSERQTAFQRFVEAQPAAEDYACFRAVGEHLRTPWPDWPQPLRDGVLTGGDYGEDAKRYHLYVQWLVHEQLQTLSEKARQRGPGLYLDLPLGVHLYGYDVWREREGFAIDASGGAPPDAVFTKGQDWGFPPLHPERNRAQGYRYVIAYLRNHFQHAGLLRIDHVMGLHRLFWVPRGFEASQGVYVRYPAEELYALLSLESHRYQSVIVGENLGTVPSYVNTTMARHKIHRMYVVQYELPGTVQRPLRAVPAAAVASLNTHDMPLFAAFWQGLDLHDRVEQGLMDETGLQFEQRNLSTIKEALVALLQRRGWLQEQAADMLNVLQACLSYLAASPAQVALVNLEDLWLETFPQNLPGTGDEHPNWRRKTSDCFEVWSQLPQVITALETVNRLRKRGRK